MFKNFLLNKLGLLDENKPQGKAYLREMALKKEKELKALEILNLSKTSRKWYLAEISLIVDRTFDNLNIEQIIQMKTNYNIKDFINFKCEIDSSWIEEPEIFSENISINKVKITCLCLILGDYKIGSVFNGDNYKLSIIKLGGNLYNTCFHSFKDQYKGKLCESGKSFQIINIDSLTSEFIKAKKEQNLQNRRIKKTFLAIKMEMEKRYSSEKETPINKIENMKIEDIHSELWETVAKSKIKDLDMFPTDLLNDISIEICNDVFNVIEKRQLNKNIEIVETLNSEYNLVEDKVENEIEKDIEEEFVEAIIVTEEDTVFENCNIELNC